MSRVIWLCVLGLAGCNQKGTANKDGADAGPTGPSVNTDADGDGIPDDEDNCADATNADQTDADGDDIGDACDALTDVDGDAIDDPSDNCPGIANADQADGDGDLRGDSCDNCPAVGNADQADTNADLIGDACPCDACGTDWCVVHPDAPTVAACQPACLEERQAAPGICCPLGSRTDGNGNCPLPDIWLDVARLEESLTTDREEFSVDSCEYIEQCINGTGMRTLLKFDTRTPSTGDGDLYLGRPEDQEPGVFVWSECHQHNHFETYAKYEILDSQGNLMAPGLKQAFCLLDWEPIPGTGEQNGDWEYHCNYQGISKNWADVYSAGLDCQFVDVTDVPAGDYTLKVTLNSDHLLAELDYANNVVEVPITLQAAPAP